MFLVTKTKQNVGLPMHQTHLLQSFDLAQELRLSPSDSALKGQLFLIFQDRIHCPCSSPKFVLLGLSLRQ